MSPRIPLHGTIYKKFLEGGGPSLIFKKKNNKKIWPFIPEVRKKWLQVNQLIFLPFLSPLFLYVFLH